MERKRSGRGAQANIEACGAGMFQPACAKLSTITSRPFAIDRAHLAHAIVRTVERGCRRDLYRREGAVIEIALHARQRRAEPFVADGESHAPASHRKSLRH